VKVNDHQIINKRRSFCYLSKELILRHRNMESNSRAPAFQKKIQSIRKSEFSVGSWNSEECQMTGLLPVVCSMMLARRLQTADR